MKKWKILAALVFTVCLTAACGRADSETESAAQTVAAAVESIGGVWLDPIADGVNFTAPSSTDTLHLYIEREHVTPGEGSIRLYLDEDDSVVTEIAADSKLVTFAPLSEEAQEKIGIISSGTEVTISLDVPLSPHTFYYIVVSTDFAMYGETGNNAVGGEDGWPLVIGD